MAVLQQSQDRNPASRYLTRAALHAEQSDHKLHKMGAIIIKGGNVIGMGWNKNKTHPRSKNKNYPTIHAELSALINSGIFHSYGTKDADMYVVRVTKGGSMATSKPCEYCMVLLKEAHIKSVTFINEQGEIACLDL